MNNGVSLINILMHAVQIVGMAITISILRAYTSLPFWGAFIWGVLLFFPIFWISLYFLFLFGRNR